MELESIAVMKHTIEPHIDLGVAAFLLGGMSKRWVRDKIKNGELEGYLLGNKLVVTVASVNELRRRSRVSPDSAASTGE